MASPELLVKRGCSMFFFLLAVSVAGAMPAPAWAEDSGDTGWWHSVKNSLSLTWQSPDYELYIPLNTWHNRRYYSADDVDHFNERPWGLGLGKYRFDDDGNWHAWYLMAFKDSHNEIEPLGGYAYQKIWRPSEHVRLGVGYTLGVTMREDSDYLPMPVLVPLMSLKYRDVALQSTYVPGGQGHGNILFTWLRWQM